MRTTRRNSRYERVQVIGSEALSPRGRERTQHPCPARSVASPLDQGATRALGASARCNVASRVRTMHDGTMHSFRVAMSFCLLLLSSVLSGCSGAEPDACNTSNCTGCCDTAGVCQTGIADSACGTGGAMCNACGNGLSCSPMGCQARTLRVFTTAATFDGNLRLANGEGRSTMWHGEADGLCTKAANAAGLSGGWQAFLPYQTTVSAADRLMASGPWHLVGTDEVVFADKASLAGNPAVALNRDEHGAIIPGESIPVWTSLWANGLYAYMDCSGWTVSYSQHSSTQGNASQAETWKFFRETSCDVRAHLYCFQM